MKILGYEALAFSQMHIGALSIGLEDAFFLGIRV